MTDAPSSAAGRGRSRPAFGKRFNRIGAYSQLSLGSFFVIASLVGALLVPWHARPTKFLFGLLGFFLLLGLLMALGALVSVRQLRRPGNVAANVSQYANADQWNVTSTLPSAATSPGETVVDWMGPMSMHGWGFSSRASIVQDKETDRNPFNTLLLTTSQVIGVMLSPEDLARTDPSSTRQGITTLLNQSSLPTFNKQIDFTAVNRSQWDRMVTTVTADGLSEMLERHLNFGLPYGQLRGFTPRTGWLNPGIEFHLRDGRTMTCVALREEQIGRVVKSLSGHLPRV